MPETSEQFEQLDRLGYVVVPVVMSPEFRCALKQQLQIVFEQEGENAGAEFKQEQGCGRLANLVNKGEIFRHVIGDEFILKFVRSVLGPGIKLSSLNVRRADPQNETRQPLHADMAAVADEHGYWVCNTVWLLDHFTTENGPIRVVPGSHRAAKLPQNELGDPLAPHEDEVFVTAKAGDVIVMNAHLWHAGTENKTDNPRTALHAFYCRRDKPQQQYQKGLLDETVKRSLNPTLRELLALDDPQNDKISVNVEVRSGFLK